MRVCVDIQSVLAQRAGVGRYTRSLVQHLAAEPAIAELALFYFDFRRRGLPFDPAGARPRAVRWLPGRAASFLWKTVNWPPFQWFAGEADVYHFPNFVLPPLRGGKAVVTIHDMSFLRYPAFAEARNRRYLTARIADTARRADAIITDSRFSAGEITALLKADPARVHPIHLGIADSFRPPDAAAAAAARRRLGIARPYLLTVGTVEPRKNLPFLADVFERLEGVYRGALVVAGTAGWHVEPILRRMRESPRAADIRYISYVADADLPSLYAGADLFLCASFYEGFGFPPLEAMACGAPVVSSCGGALREVLGDGARLIEGFDADGWAGTVARLLADEPGRRALAAAGRRRAARYSWAETARRTADVYRQVTA